MRRVRRWKKIQTEINEEDEIRKTLLTSEEEEKIVAKLKRNK
jgi:hypothetical protein